MYQKEVLPNNLRLIKVPMSSVESVVVQVFVRVGGRDETKEKMGLSHFLEHMVFRGTTKRSTMKAIFEEIEKVGGYHNAGTSKEYTVFYAKVPKEKIEIAFDVLSDSLFNSLFKKESIEKEKQVIIEEINVNEDIPMAKVEDLFLELLYPQHALGFDLAGTKETVAAFKREDIISYLKKHNLSNNAVLAVSGNFADQTVKKLVQKYFSSWLKGEIVPINNFSDRQQKPQLKILSKKTDQSHLCLGFKVFGAQHQDRFKLQVLNAILGFGASSRLFETLREKEGLCYYIGSDFDLCFETGIWQISAGVDNKRVLRAVKLILAELMKIRNSRVTKKELVRAKEFLKGTKKISLERPEAQGGFFALQELLKNEIMTVEEICRKIDEVTADDLLMLARRLIKNERLNLALVGPSEKEEAFKELLWLKD